MTTAKNKLRDKMALGASSPDKFAAAELVMAEGGLTPAALRPEVLAPPLATPVKKATRTHQVTTAQGKQPAGEGQAVRESLTLLPEESQLIDSLRLRLATLGVIPNRSEVLRAGILALTQLDNAPLATVVARVEKLKPGRKS